MCLPASVAAQPAAARARVDLLAGTVAAGGDIAPFALCDHILTNSGARPNRDDIALLAVRRDRPLWGL